MTMPEIIRLYDALIQERNKALYARDEKAAKACQAAIDALFDHPAIKMRRNIALDALMAETGHLE